MSSCALLVTYFAYIIDQAKIRIWSNVSACGVPKLYSLQYFHSSRPLILSKDHVAGIQGYSHVHVTKPISPRDQALLTQQHQESLSAM